MDHPRQELNVGRDTEYEPKGKNNITGKDYQTGYLELWFCDSSLYPTVCNILTSEEAPTFDLHTTDKHAHLYRAIQRNLDSAYQLYVAYIAMNSNQ